VTAIDPRNGLSAADITHRDMLRSTAAMINNRWPGQYGDIAQRLEDLTLRIDGIGTSMCELPHLSIDEEECDRQRAAAQKGAS
jgi:hypothetical protein